jgi:hypothetical protein
MALNAESQGSAADIMKVAMLDVAKRMTAVKLVSRLLLQVHDELIFEVAEGEEEVLTQIVRAGTGGSGHTHTSARCEYWSWKELGSGGALIWPRAESICL